MENHTDNIDPRNDSPKTHGHKVLAVPIAFNEEKKIGMVLDRILPGLVDEILVVDDASTDGTPEIVLKKGTARIISHERRKGAGAAIRSGIKYARENGFDVIVILAGNNKDCPAEIPRLLEPIRKEGYDIVQGSRYLPGGVFGSMPFYRQIATRLHPLLFSLLTGCKITDSTNGFRAIRLSLFNDPRMNIDQEWLDRYELEPYILYKAITLGYRYKEAPVTKIYPPKDLGYTKMKPITGWWSILKPLFYLSLGIKR